MRLWKCLLRYPTLESGKLQMRVKTTITTSGQGAAEFPRRVPAIWEVVLCLSCFTSGAEAQSPPPDHPSSSTSQEPIRRIWMTDSRSRERSISPRVRNPATEPSFRGSTVSRATIDLKNTAWWRIAMEKGVDPYLLYAVALLESARVSDGLAAPWPWALNRGGKTLYPENPEQAIAQLRASLAERNMMIDVGLMQVNLRWHGRRVDKPEDIIDPVINLRIGADILAEAIASAPGDLALGVGRYHSWRDLDAAYRYGRKVLLIADWIRPFL
jgi:hypothetical protein